jgi:MFS family permease
MPSLRKSSSTPYNRFVTLFNLYHIPRPIWALSISTLLMTLSGSIVFTIAPHYLVDVLKLDKQAVGWMEGVVESFALIVRMVSGSLSDFFVRRKLIILVGYIISTIAKIGMPFAYGVTILYFARITERIGNGLQAAPREALVGDLAPAEVRGACYGVRNACGKAGSSLGALVVFFILFSVLNSRIGSDTYQFIFLVGIVPSLLACIILYLFVKDKPCSKKEIESSKLKPFRFNLKDLKFLGKRFWILMIVVTVFNFSHFSETFLQLRAREVGVSVVFAPLVMVLMNLTIAMTSYPVGNLSDKFGRRIFLALGFVCVIMSDLLLAFGNGYTSVFIAIMFWGVQMAMTQGMVATLVTDIANPDYRGTAFGVLNVLTGIVYFIASPLYGWIWDSFGGLWPFLSSAVVTMISFVLLFTLMKRNFFKIQTNNDMRA